MTLRDVIPPGAVIGIDTAPFIYYIQRVSPFVQLSAELFEDCIRARRNIGVTTVVTVAEVLVGAFLSSEAGLDDRFRSILYDNPPLRLVDIDVTLAERAARVRAQYRLSLTDALQIAACLDAGASFFVTNDRDLRRVQELTVVVLSDFAS